MNNRLDTIKMCTLAEKDNLILVDGMIPQVYEILDSSKDYEKIGSFAKVGINYKDSKEMAIKYFYENY